MWGGFVEKYALLARGMDMRVPEPVRRGGREVVRGYLRALFQCDGTARDHVGRTDSHDVVLATISEDLMRDVQRLLANSGIPAATKNTDSLSVAYGASPGNSFDLFVKQSDLERAREVLAPLLESQEQQEQA